jgi:hypothetical protein
MFLDIDNRRYRIAMQISRRSKTFCTFLLALMLSPDFYLRAEPSSSQARPDDRREIALSAEERSLILGGKIVLRDLPSAGSIGRTFEAIGVLPGSLDEAFAVLTDYGSYPEYMPNVGALKIRAVAGASSIVETTLYLPLGFRKQYRLRYTSSREDSGFLLSWEKLPWPELKPSQTVTDTSGYWSVRKFEGGGNLAVYHVYTDPGPVPLGLTNFFQGLAKSSFPDGIVKLRERIRNLYRPGR